VDNDHYCPFVIYSSGTHELPRDTQYLGVGVRIQVFNPNDEDEVALFVNIIATLEGIGTFMSSGVLLCLISNDSALTIYLILLRSLI
jgi:hypothetical protein